MHNSHIPWEPGITSPRRPKITYFWRRGPQESFPRALLGLQATSWISRAHGMIWKFHVSIILSNMIVIIYIILITIKIFLNSSTYKCNFEVTFYQETDIFITLQRGNTLKMWQWKFWTLFIEKHDKINYCLIPHFTNIKQNAQKFLQTFWEKYISKYK